MEVEANQLEEGCYELHYEGIYGHEGEYQSCDYGREEEVESLEDLSNGVITGNLIQILIINSS